MNAVVNNPPDVVNLEIDGTTVQVAKGSMIIQAADRLGVSIPRFCYHKKLPIAANCRMCLVDIEKSPKPVPACATPVMEGMKVYTQSKRTLDSQRNVMEFLLINHPLDCPICDQGGECELQDVAMGYGRSVSRFTERKRVVADEDMGPLVATDMTRCIHCTRCVRFMSDIAGTFELGGMNRGENLEIGTYIGKSLTSELSGNIIDVCPVGALTNKVFRFKARAWELVAKPSIGYHDALGSNLFLHVKGGKVLRAVPRDNENVNECWVSDRDRYSHQGLEAEDRAQQPMLRDASGRLQSVSWEEALAFVAEKAASVVRQHGGDQLGALVNPMTSNEEGALIAQLLRSLGSDHIDHRLKISDFGDRPVAAVFELPLAQVEEADRILLVGCNPREELPLLGHRIRKAWKKGAQVWAVNPVDYDFNFSLAGKSIASPFAMVNHLASVAKAIAAKSEQRPPLGILALVDNAEKTDAAAAIAASLQSARKGALILGGFGAQHPMASALRALSRYIAKAANLHFNELPCGANAVGLAQYGVVPGNAGLNAAEMLARPRKGLFLYNVELPLDMADWRSMQSALKNAALVVSFSAYLDEYLLQAAHAVLPIGLLPEIDATLTNLDGISQTLKPAAKPPGEARPGWKVLRALGAQMNLAGFAFTDVESLRKQMRVAHVDAAPSGDKTVHKAHQVNTHARIATTPIYRGDAVVRRARALQETPLGGMPFARLHPGDALALGLEDGDRAEVSDGTERIVLSVKVDPRVPHGAAWIESGFEITSRIAGTGAQLHIKKAQS